MQYRLNDILAFLQAMETGSISTAAQRMGLSKSVISKRITDLEVALKVELLHRSTRGVRSLLTKTKGGHILSADLLTMISCA